MGMLLFAVVMINGKVVAFEADEVASTEEKYIFLANGEAIGEFERRNVAGYFTERVEDDEKAD